MFCADCPTIPPTRSQLRPASGSSLTRRRRHERKRSCPPRAGQKGGSRSIRFRKPDARTSRGMEDLKRELRDTVGERREVVGRLNGELAATAADTPEAAHQPASRRSRTLPRATNRSLIRATPLGTSGPDGRSGSGSGISPLISTTRPEIRRTGTSAHPSRPSTSPTNLQKRSAQTVGPSGLHCHLVPLAVGHRRSAPPIGPCNRFMTIAMSTIRMKSASTCCSYPGRRTRTEPANASPTLRRHQRLRRVTLYRNANRSSRPTAKRHLFQFARSIAANRTHFQSSANLVFAPPKFARPPTYAEVGERGRYRSAGGAPHCHAPLLFR